MKYFLLMMNYFLGESYHVGFLGVSNGVKVRLYFPFNDGLYYNKQNNKRANPSWAFVMPLKKLTE